MEYAVYWIKDGRERDGVVSSEEKLEEWVEWAKKHTAAYGYTRKTSEVT